MKKEVSFHTSEDYTKHALYERWITSKTEVTSLLVVVKEMKQEVNEDTTNENMK